MIRHTGFARNLVARNLVLVAGALAFIGAGAAVGCGGSESNGAAHAATSPAAKTVTIPAEGMSCGACAARVKQTLKKIAGVQDVQVNLERRNIQVRYLEGQVSFERLVAAINQLGYKAGKPSAETGQATPAGSRMARIPIEGMACEEMCVPRVKKAIEAIDGVTKVEVSLKPGDARIQYVPAKISPEQIVSVINALGFKAGRPVLEQ